MSRLTRRLALALAILLGVVGCSKLLSGGSASVFK